MVWRTRGRTEVRGQYLILIDDLPYYPFISRSQIAPFLNVKAMWITIAIITHIQVTDENSTDDTG